MRSTRVSFAALACLAALLIGGCVKTPPSGKVAEKPVEASASATVRGDLPTATPEGLPLWPEATVVSGRVARDGAFTLLLNTGDPADEVVTGLNNGFIDSGWNVQGSIEDSSAVELQVSDSRFEGLVTVYPAQKGNYIEYLLTPAQ